MAEALCANTLHDAILRTVVELLDAPAFGTPVVRIRARLARQMAAAGLYDVAGDGDALMADEKPAAVRATEAWEPPPHVRDFRSLELREQDAKLEGTWFRCEEHGLTHDPVTLCDVSYCPAEDCNRAVLLVATWSKERRT